MPVIAQTDNGVNEGQIPPPLLPGIGPFEGDEARTLSSESSLSTIPLAPPRPGEGPDSLASFIDSLKGNDAAIEVIVGQGRILTIEVDITEGPDQPLIAVGDPSVVEFAVVTPRQIRVTGLRVGVTDLSITTAQNETYSFEVRVVADLTLLEGKLRETFPEASLKLGQLRDHVIVEGEARDQVQVARIVETITAYLQSVTVAQERRIRGQRGTGAGMAGAAGAAGMPMQPGAQPIIPGLTPAPEVVDPLTGQLMDPALAGLPMGLATPELGGPLQITGSIAPAQLINLIRVPGSQQVMLKVRVAELNRTALRRIGSNFLGVDPDSGAIVGSQIAGPAAALGEVLPVGRDILGSAVSGANINTTVFGIFEDGNFLFMLNALRRNSFLKILAEPNLVAMNGQQASFLAGGEFPVPVPQVGVSGVAPTITVQFREFGVRLGFVPYILDDGTIRLTVAPEVSQIDFAISVTLVAGGTPVPGLNTRKALTTVELQEGQTLAIAGLLQLSLDGTTDRIPGLGDLPFIGPFFSNTTGQRIEKELVVLVTPYLIEPMNKDQVGPGPGDEVMEPNDLEFYLLNRIEGRTGRDFRSTTAFDPLHLRYHLNLERKYLHGPVGFSD